MVKIKNDIARKFIERHGAKLHASNATHAFYKKGHVIICVSINKDMELAHLQAIATEQLGITMPIENFKQQLATIDKPTIKK